MPYPRELYAHYLLHTPTPIYRNNCIELYLNPNLLNHDFTGFAPMAFQGLGLISELPERGVAGVQSDLTDELLHPSCYQFYGHYSGLHSRTLNML